MEGQFQHELNQGFYFLLFEEKTLFCKSAPPHLVDIVSRVAKGDDDLDTLLSQRLGFLLHRLNLVPKCYLDEKILLHFIVRMSHKLNELEIMGGTNVNSIFSFNSKMTSCNGKLYSVDLVT